MPNSGLVVFSTWGLHLAAPVMEILDQPDPLCACVWGGRVRKGTSWLLGHHGWDFAFARGEFSEQPNSPRRLRRWALLLSLPWGKGHKCNPVILWEVVYLCFLSVQHERSTSVCQEEASSSGLSKPRDHEWAGVEMLGCRKARGRGC